MKPLPRWVTLWLPIGVLLVAAVTGIAVLLEGGEPEPVGIDNGPVPTQTSGRDGPLSFVVRSADCGFENVIAEETIPADGQFCLAGVRVTAGVSGSTARLDLGCQFLITETKDRFLTDDQATLAGADAAPFRTGIPSGDRVRVELTFDVPKDARAVGLELHSGCDSPGVRLAFVGTEPGS